MLHDHTNMHKPPFPWNYRIQSRHSWVIKSSPFALDPQALSHAKLWHHIFSCISTCTFNIKGLHMELLKLGWFDRLPTRFTRRSRREVDSHWLELAPPHIVTEQASYCSPRKDLVTLRDDNGELLTCKGRSMEFEREEMKGRWCSTGGGRKWETKEGWGFLGGFGRVGFGGLHNWPVLIGHPRSDRDFARFDWATVKMLS